VIYIASTFVLMGMISTSQLQNSPFPFSDAGKILFGSNTAIVVAICAVVAGLGALNACILVQGQIMFAAARDNLFPRVFAKLSKNNVPVKAQLFSSVLISLFLIATRNPSLLKQFDNIALLAAFLLLATYLLVALAEMKFLSEEHKSLFKGCMQKSSWFVLPAVIYSVWMMLSLNYEIIVVGAVLVLVCIPVYYFTVRKYALEG
jgi:APA family basic amino acid/polyamine antiporter